MKDKEMIEEMHMIPVSNLEDAIKIAKEIVGVENPSITAIPDGVSVVVEE